MSPATLDDPRERASSRRGWARRRRTCSRPRSCSRRGRACPARAALDGRAAADALGGAARAEHSAGRRARARARSERLAVRGARLRRRGRSRSPAGRRRCPAASAPAVVERGADPRAPADAGAAVGAAQPRTSAARTGSRSSADGRSCCRRWRSAVVALLGRGARRARRLVAGLLTLTWTGGTILIRRGWSASLRRATSCSPRRAMLAGAVRCCRCSSGIAGATTIAVALALSAARARPRHRRPAAGGAPCRPGAIGVGLGLDAGRRRQRRLERGSGAGAGPAAVDGRQFLGRLSPAGASSTRSRRRSPASRRSTATLRGVAWSPAANPPRRGGPSDAR